MEVSVVLAPGLLSSSTFPRNWMLSAMLSTCKTASFRFWMSDGTLDIVSRNRFTLKAASATCNDSETTAKALATMPRAAIWLVTEGQEISCLQGLTAALVQRGETWGFNGHHIALEHLSGRLGLHVDSLLLHDIAPSSSTLSFPSHMLTQCKALGEDLGGKGWIIPLCPDRSCR